MPTTATRRNRAKPELALSVQYASRAAGLPTRSLIRRWVRAALEREGSITVRFVDEEEGRALNRDYRGRDYATNVLSFSYETQPVEGDIVICVPVTAREAREQGKSFEAHCAHLVVHGVLHLQGYDHETDDEARVMEGRESEIVTKLGYPDPYPPSA